MEHERGLVMVMHSSVVAVIIYVVMFYLLKQSPRKAEDKSVLIGALVLMYMVLFGHQLPLLGNLNGNLNFRELMNRN
jgi:hypothetical protein